MPIILSKQGDDEIQKITKNYKKSLYKYFLLMSVTTFSISLILKKNFVHKNYLSYPWSARIKSGICFGIFSTGMYFGEKKTNVFFKNEKIIILNNEDNLIKDF